MGVALSLPLTTKAMIQYNPKSWFSLIFAAYSRQVFRRLFPLLLAMGVLSAGVCYVELHYLQKPVELSNVVHSLLGFVLSLFLVFRTNTRTTDGGKAESNGVDS